MLAAALSGVFTTVGLGISYGADWPAGAAIVLLAGVVYAMVNLVAGLLRRREAGAS